MAAFESWFRQDLKKPVAVRQLTGNLFSADNAANLIGVEILDDNVPVEISGTVMGYIIRSDGTTVLVQGTLDGNKCSVTLPSSCYAVIGRISIVIKLGTTTVLACTGYVYQASTDAIVDPGSVIPSISELLEKIDEMEQGTAAANSAAQNANAKATLADTAASKIDNMTVSASKLPEEASPTAQISEVSGHKHIAFGIPQGVTQIEFDDLSEQVINKSPAIECSASGSIASFPDGAAGMPVKTLTVAIEPEQDLHGQDSPWPAGGWKNLMPMTVAGIKAINTVGTWSGNVYSISGMTYKLNTDSDGNITSIVANGTSSVNYPNLYLPDLTIPAGTYTISGGPDSVGCIFYAADDFRSGYNLPTSTKTFSEETTLTSIRLCIMNMSTANNLVFYPMIESGSSATSYAPYSNICPISGWTGANVSRTGVNAWDEEWETGNINSTTGENSQDNNKIRSKGYISIKPNTQYYVTVKNGTAGNFIYFEYDINKNYLGTQYSVNNGLGTFTTTANAYYIRFRLVDTYGATYNNDISINYPATDTQYHPGHVQQIEYEFPSSAGTVYGGTLTIHQDGSGELVVDRANVDLGTLSWEYDSGANSRMRALLNGIKNIPNTETPNMKCSQYVCLPLNQIYAHTVDKCIGVHNSNSNLWVYDSLYTDATEFKTAMSGVQLVYELATPVTYQLTNQQVIETLKGVNNLWSSTGSVSVEYPADTRLFIEKRISELQALILENISNS